MFYGTGAITHESVTACVALQEARQLRQKYYGGNSTTWEDLESPNLVFQMGKEGVVELFLESDEEKANNLCRVANVAEFSEDYHRLVDIVNHGTTRSFAFQRLQILSSAFRMHITMNGAVEATEQSNLLGTDFYRTLKIDNHIHAAAAPSAKQFVGYVSRKLEQEPDAVVSPDGKTLSQVFHEAGIDKDHLTIDAFNVLADYSVYQRFDNFNAKYSPFRMADMRRIFLKTSNHMGGRYFAELMKLTLSRHEIGKGHNSAAEMRLSIYGMERHEWKDLATWMLKDWDGEWPGPVLSGSNRWLIQIPRLWRIYCSKPGSDNRSFDEMLENIFVPMFEATLYPDQHPEVAEALKNIVGFDSVDDEGSAEVRIMHLSTFTMLLYGLCAYIDLPTCRKLVPPNARMSGLRHGIRRIGGSCIICGQIWRC
jgi:AMP deaminase